MWHSSSSITLTPTSLRLMDIMMRYFSNLTYILIQYLVLDENCLIVFLQEKSLMQARILEVCE